jgi:erythromycin esterase-like protein/predicted phosphoribosyltransferase
VVRKLGVPGFEELAMGAIASGGVVVINDDLVRGVSISAEVIQRVAEQEGRELLRREQAYRGSRPMPDLADKTVILVDDGLATGSSMRAAIEALRQHRPAKIVVAVPAAPKSTCQELAAIVDEVVCATTPSPFVAVGRYRDFTQTIDKEVWDLLRAAATTASAPTGVQDLTEVGVIRAAALPTENGVPSDEVLFDLVSDAQVVLLEEASHGTHDFYAARAEITRRLIKDQGFCAVAVEGDWPNAYGVNRHVHGRSLDGLDLYSLYRSIQEVIDYLERVGPAAARARERYACFDHYGGDDGQTYGFAAALWNLRDRHMVEIPHALRDHLTQQRGESAKIVTWEHNSHIGNARATEMAARGELNVGQLVRKNFGTDCRNLGFTTYSGTVTAADDWGGPAQRKWVRPALSGSVEELFHEVGQKEFMLFFGAASHAAETLRAARLERAIGVIYRSETERQSHYFQARVSDQFDAVVHIDDTRAVEPLERTASWEEGEAPETYPFAV